MTSFIPLGDARQDIVAVGSGAYVSGFTLASSSSAEVYHPWR